MNINNDTNINTTIYDKKPMNVLSLFDGMSCGQIALNRAKIPYGRYYAAEIDKHAIIVTQANYPKTVQLGDVTKWKEWDIDWSSIGLVMAGSPCQGFSFAGKQLAFDDPRSALFFTFVEIWQHVKKNNPDANYLLENVKMAQEHELVISRYMGVHPIEINSALVSAQNRQRLYWTSIANQPYGLFGDMACTIPQPEDKGLLLRDVLEEDVDEKYLLSDKMLNYFDKRAKNFNQGKVNLREENGKASCLTSSMASCDISDNFVLSGTWRTHHDGKGFREIKSGKAATIPARAREDGSGQNVVAIPEATKKGYAEIKPGECFDATFPESKTRRGRLMEDKSNCLTATKYDFMHYDTNYRIRRLTPVECERLQTVDDNYTAHVSDTQRYKMLGNGWTVDVIVHILSYMDSFR